MKDKSKNFVGEYRLRKKWTQAQLAKEPNVSLATVLKAEIGQFVTDLSKGKIAGALEAPVEALFP